MASVVQNSEFYWPDLYGFTPGASQAFRDIFVQIADDVCSCTYHQDSATWRIEAPAHNGEETFERFVDIMGVFIDQDLASFEGAGTESLIDTLTLARQAGVAIDPVEASIKGKGKQPVKDLPDVAKEDPKLFWMPEYEATRLRELFTKPLLAELSELFACWLEIDDMKNGVTIKGASDDNIVAHVYERLSNIETWAHRTPPRFHQIFPERETDYKLVFPKVADVPEDLLCKTVVKIPHQWEHDLSNVRVCRIAKYKLEKHNYVVPEIERAPFGKKTLFGYFRPDAIKIKPIGDEPKDNQLSSSDRKSSSAVTKTEKWVAGTQSLASNASQGLPIGRPGPLGTVSYPDDDFNGKPNVQANRLSNSQSKNEGRTSSKRATGSGMNQGPNVESIKSQPIASSSAQQGFKKLYSPQGLSHSTQGSKVSLNPQQPSTRAPQSHIRPWSTPQQGQGQSSHGTIPKSKPNNETQDTGGPSNQHKKGFRHRPNSKTRRQHKDRKKLASSVIYEEPRVGPIARFAGSVPCLDSPIADDKEEDSEASEQLDSQQPPVSTGAATSSDQEHQCEEESDSEPTIDQVQAKDEEDEIEKHKTMGQRAPPKKGGGEQRKDRKTKTQTSKQETEAWRQEIAAEVRLGPNLQQALRQSRASGHQQSDLPSKKAEVPAEKMDELYGRCINILEHARSFRGRLNFEVQLTVNLLLFSKVEDKEFVAGQHDLGHAQGYLNNHNAIGGGVRGSAAARLTNVAEEMEYLIGVKDANNKDSVFANEPSSTEMVYEFACQSDRGNQFTVEIDEHGSAIVKQPTQTIGEVFWHYPKRIHDACLLVSGTSFIASEDPSIAELIDNLCIRIPATEDMVLLPDIQSRMTTRDVRIASIFLKRRLHFPAVSTAAPAAYFRLQITEVHELIVETSRSGAIHAFALSPEEMAQEGCAPYYEAALVPAGLPSEMTENEELEPGLEAGWRAKDVLGQSQLEWLVQVAGRLVGRLDRVGVKREGGSGEEASDKLW